MYHNIEKSAFRLGEYVGYAGGKVYRIARMQRTHWMATEQNGSGVLRAGTLREISRKLENC